MADKIVQRRGIMMQLGLLLLVWSVLLGIFWTKSRETWNGALRTAVAPVPMPSPATSELREVAKGVYEWRFEAYQAGLDRMRGNLKWQGILVALIILTLGGGVHEAAAGSVSLTQGVIFTIPYFLPAALLFLWIDCGYLYHALIDNRLILLSMMEGMEATVPEGYRSAAILSDQLSLVDLWLLLFEAKPTAPISSIPLLNGTHSLYYVKAALSILFFAIVHACLFAPYVKFLSVGRARAWSTQAVGAFAVCVFLMLVVFSTHWEFGIPGHKPNWAQALILLTCPCIVCVMIKILPLQAWKKAASICSKCERRSA